MADLYKNLLEKIFGHIPSAWHEKTAIGGLLSPNSFILCQKRIIAFGMLRVFDDTVYWADFVTGGRVIKAHAFGA